jgi:tRNA1(Val) A37 N6-methylase TrmN6
MFSDEILYSATVDRFLGGRVTVAQPKDGYRAAIDPVLLAAACPAVAGETVLDLGCGVGTASLCLLARVPGARAVGLELQPELAALARANASANGADFQVVEGSALKPPAGLRGFDHVVTNPPYLDPATATRPPHGGKSLANVEAEVPLAAWLASCLRVLRPKGRLTLIHRADRLAEILAGLAGKAGAVRVAPLWPKDGRPAGRVLVSAVKGARTPLVLLPGLVLHRPDGGFTEQAEALLRDGQGLEV